MSRSIKLPEAEYRLPQISRYLPFLLLILLSALVCTGQQMTGRLHGTAYDQTGAVIPNAQVVVTNQANNTTRNTVANGDGYFTVTALQPGTYTVTVSASGF